MDTPAPPVCPARSEPTSAQAAVQARVHGLVKLVSGHAIPGQQAAFRALLKGRGVYDTGSAVSLASFSTPAKVSLPASLLGAPRRLDVLLLDL